MCASAIANVNIFRVYYAASFDDSKPFGFSDDKYYEETFKGDILSDWVHIKKQDSYKPFEA